MSLNVEVSPFTDQARGVAERAAAAARVQVVDEFEMDRLNDIADLLIAVWGTAQQDAPIPAELLRSISHAGCNVTAAYDARGVLCGAAAAIVSPETDSVYSLIAGVRAGLADAGVGFALKQHQRAWALARGLGTMMWTFDPLVSRNARFNLTKLGATSSEYVRDFYGPMADGINADDDSDRLVAVWSLTSDRTVASSEGLGGRVELPDFSMTDVRALGPDEHPVLIAAGDSLWCRVPADIVALRGQDRMQATAWRACIRDILTEAFAAGRTARGVTRAGWYRLANGVES
ncbi:MAG: hypothetical protein EPN48_10520 [Microbacteriaceae bacterium]|nr:MAG: hypothetical protein EPN48_10520 [Microbacteriaceae bacterium]